MPYNTAAETPRPKSWPKGWSMREKDAQPEDRSARHDAHAGHGHEVGSKRPVMRLVALLEGKEKPPMMNMGGFSLESLVLAVLGVGVGVVVVGVTLVAVALVDVVLLDSLLLCGSVSLRPWPETHSLIPFNRF